MSSCPAPAPARRRRGWPAVLIGPALCAAACDPTAVGVRLVFPSERAFLASALARIDVYDGGGVGAGSPDAICRSLSVNPPAPPPGVKPIATSGGIDVCSFRAGGVVLDDVGVGRRVFFVETQDFSAQSIVRGCTVVDVSAEPQDLEGDDDGAARELGVDGFITIQLATLPDFPTDEPTCATIAEKCEENVACVP